MRRMTRQKRILFGAVERCSSLFDAYELHAEVSTVDERISLATVYRFLNTLEKDRKVHWFMCGSKKIYSTTVNRHAHFTCERCGSMSHIDIKNADFLKEIVDADVCHFQIELSGVCSSCRSEN